MNNKWIETIKLGKNVVYTKLSTYHIRFDSSMNYFKLCSLLYQHEKELHVKEEAIAQEEPCVGAIETVEVIENKKWSKEHIRDYRQRYLGMRNYIQDWFDRANTGELAVNPGILIDTTQMWQHYKKVDKYSGIKRVYNYLYLHDDDRAIESKSELDKLIKYKSLKDMYGYFK